MIKFWLILPAMLPAWVISGAFSKDPGIRGLLRTLVHPPNWGWPAVALISMPAFLLLPSVVAHFFGVPLQWPARQGSAWAYAASGSVKFCYALMFAGVLEEPGWRGFLLERLQHRFSPLLASLLVWLPWALWHAPLDFGGWVANSWILYLGDPDHFYDPSHHSHNLDLQSLRPRHFGGRGFPCRVQHISYNFAVCPKTVCADFRVDRIRGGERSDVAKAQ